MVMTYEFRGVIVPVFTPFNDKYELNLDLIPQYGDYLYNKGIKGILVGGTTGEGVSMSVTERKTVLEAWAKVVAKTKQSLMVQIGGTALVEVQEMARHAESMGVDAILCLPDLYFHPHNVDELVHYFTHVSSAAPNTPLHLYHIPSFTGVQLDMVEFLNKGREKVPSFSGIKYTCNDMEEGARCIQTAGNDLRVFLGADQIVASAAVVGFDSTVATCANLWPRMFDDIFRLVKEDRIQEAIKIQTDLASRINNVIKHGDESWLSTTKFAMKLVSGFDMGPARPPIIPLTHSKMQEIKENIKVN